MRAAPRRLRGPRVLGLGGDSPARSAGASSPAALPLPAQVPLPGAARAAHSGPWPHPVPALFSPRRAALGQLLLRTPTLPWAALLVRQPLRTGAIGRVTRAPGFSSFGGRRPRRAAKRKCLSLEPRGEGGPLPASAWIDAGWPEGLRDVREIALPRATPGPPPGRQNREGLVPGRWLHQIGRAHV